jgi:uncharacterized protein (TIGR03086 family)
MSVELLQRVVTETTRVVDSITPDELGNATPCAEWTVRDVVNHITGGATMFAISAEQGRFPTTRSSTHGRRQPGDFKAAWAPLRRTR